MSRKKNSDSKISSVRIIGGSLRSRKISFQDQPGLRPTSDRLRETLFNWLRDSVAGARCLDLFAGSGALGFEALSRGASQVVFVEKNHQVCQMIVENLDSLGLSNGEMYGRDAGDWLTAQSALGVEHNSNPTQGFDIVFLDPPFAEGLLYDICGQLRESGLLREGAKVYIECGEELVITALPGSWTLLKNKKAGAVQYYLFENNKADKIKK